MPKKAQEEQLAKMPALPPGVKLVRTLGEHADMFLSVAFDPSGRMLASAGKDGVIKLWEVASGKILGTLEEHKGDVWSVKFDRTGNTLASGGSDNTVKLWDVASGKLIHTLKGHPGPVWSVAFDPSGKLLASAGERGTVKLWDMASGTDSGKQLHYLKEHRGGPAYSVAFDPSGQILASAGADATVKIWDTVSNKLLSSFRGHSGIVWCVAFAPAGRTLASGSYDKTVKLWDIDSGKLLRILEGHTGNVEAISFSTDGRLLACKCIDGNLHLWDCESWTIAAVISEPTDRTSWIPGLTFHPTLPLLVSIGSKPDSLENELSRLIHFWELDFDVLLSKASDAELVAGILNDMPLTMKSVLIYSALKAVHYTTAKIVLVGDSGVGKTGLGWRLAHGEFKEHASTHGQQFWVVNELGTRRQDGTECEAILWDLAGQADYRLTHALFLDDSDLALILFDPTDSRDPLHGVEFWLKQLKSGKRQSQNDCQTILVGARSDRGDARLTQAELDEFCRQRGILGGYLATSAKDDIGLDELLRRMKAQIPWEQKPATVTTLTFKRIKDYVLKLKENRRRRKVIVSPQDLREQLEKADKDWQFTDAEMMTAVGHLANYGYARVLRTSKGEERILLSPELLNNLAASFVLEARRNPKGLGSLEEKRLLADEYQFRELEKLSQEERDVLLDSAALLFLEHNVCFRETDPLSNQSYLVFPELINLKKPLLEDEQPTEDGAGYTVSGAVENVYASLVVLLGYTQTFTRTNQWQSQARYEVGDGLICGFRQDSSDREGELNLVLYFGTNVGKPVRALFQGLFESFLARRNLSVFRYEPVVCANSHPVNRAVVRGRLRDGKDFAFCEECGDKVMLPKADEPIQLTQTERRKVDEQQWFAAQRSRFEQAVFQVMSYVDSEKMPRPECFISYAWGDREQERWVERNLATDLQKAGIGVVLDQWENSRVGSSVPRFVERIERCDLILMVGTPLYRKKYENKETSTGYVAAAEVDLIANRLLATERQKETVLPLLLAGEKETSLPPLLHSRVYADFRNERGYFVTAFDLILDLYGINHNHQAVADLRESLRERELR